MTTLIFLRLGSALVPHDFAARSSVCSRSSVTLNKIKRLLSL